MGGRVKVAAGIQNQEFQELRRSPQELKKYFKEKGIDKVVAFQTRNPMHKAHFELTKKAASEQGAHLLLHPVVGLTKPGDLDPYTRVRCYKHILKYYPENSVTLSVLPLAMRMAGPREAVWHALIRKNYGCTHFIVGRDHAGPGSNKKGIPFYDPYEAQELLRTHSNEIGIEVAPFKMVVYIENEDIYLSIDEVTEQHKPLNISGTELRERLRNDQEMPTWFSFPEVIEELHRSAVPARI